MLYPLLPAHEGGARAGGDGEDEEEEEEVDKIRFVVDTGRIMMRVNGRKGGKEAGEYIL
jgi:phosphosulfolactate synthase (CoM biosynthesis protein A)